MTNDSITPPIELVAQWFLGAKAMPVDQWVTDVATQAAQYGADQELEACCEWLGPLGIKGGDTLRRARRPKPPSLNSIALQMLGTIESDGRYLSEITDTIRRALEALPND